MSDHAHLPYAGTSGFSGTDTSEERARNEDSAGVTGKRQRQTLDLTLASDTYGITVSELRGITGWHHGQASACLSVLHKVGELAMLEARRGRCHIYVLPQFINGRDTRPHGGKGERVTISKAEYDRLTQQSAALAQIRREAQFPF